jgi:hypothetical protein
VPFTLQDNTFTLHGQTTDLSLTGISFITPSADPIPPSVELTLHDRRPITCRCRVVYHERIGRQYRCGLTMLDVNRETRRALILNLFADANTWRDAHEDRVRSNMLMAWLFFCGIARGFRPARRTRRRIARRRTWRLVHVQVGSHRRLVLVRDWSARGAGVICLNGQTPQEGLWHFLDPVYDDAPLRPVYERRVLLLFRRVGLQADARLPREPEWELAFSSTIEQSHS